MYTHCASHHLLPNATRRHVTNSVIKTSNHRSAKSRNTHVYFTHIIWHKLCIGFGPRSDRLRRFNYVSAISIFTSQSVRCTRLPLVACGSAIILAKASHLPTATVVIHAESNPSNPFALFCKSDECVVPMADPEVAYRATVGCWPRNPLQT